MTPIPLCFTFPTLILKLASKVALFPIHWRAKMVELHSRFVVDSTGDGTIFFYSLSPFIHSVWSHELTLWMKFRSIPRVNKRRVVGVRDRIRSMSDPLEKVFTCDASFFVDLFNFRLFIDCVYLSGVTNRLNTMTDITDSPLCTFYCTYY